jgi:hypothetical protein
MSSKTANKQEREKKEVAVHDFCFWLSISILFKEPVIIPLKMG